MKKTSQRLLIKVMECFKVISTNLYRFRYAALFCLFVGFLSSFGLPCQANARSRGYMTEGEVLARAFPGAEITKKKVEITPRRREKIEEFIKGKFFKRRVIFLKAVKDGETLGYGIVSNKTGKTKKITFMVVLDGLGTVKSVDVLVFRETQGYEIENSWWRKQFVGKTVKDRVTLKKDIQNVSGATISARAVTKGVKEILAVFEVVKGELEGE